jgi:hypothetical protein
MNIWLCESFFISVTKHKGFILATVSEVPVHGQLIPFPGPVVIQISIVAEVCGRGGCLPHSSQEAESDRKELGVDSQSDMCPH